MSQIFIKHIKLSSNCRAIIKSKFENGSLKLQIFVEDTSKDNWKYYEGVSKEEDILKQCKALDIELAKIKEYLTSKVDDDSILYEIESNKKFIIYTREVIGSEDDYADIIYFKQFVNHVDYSKKCMEILLEQIHDLNGVTSELCKRNTVIEKYQGELEDICDKYEKLSAENKEFQEKFYNQFIHLLNSKKKYIKENINDNNVTKLNITHDAEKSDDSFVNTTKKSINYENDQPSTSRTPSKRPSSTNLHKTPSKTRRTPSKRFLELQQLSDSDDSFTVLSCDNVSKLSTKFTNDSLDSSRVFKNFKVKTPVKRKEDQRESSVELKIAKSSSAKDESDSEEIRGNVEEKVTNYQNAQKIDSNSNDNKKMQDLDVSSDTLKYDTQDVLDQIDEIPCSQEMPLENLSSSYSTRKSLKSRNKSKHQKKEKEEQDPFAVDTINILNC